jgi:hypothetical protein
MEANHHLSNKYALFYNMDNYYKSIGKDTFDILPLTFHVSKGSYDPQFFKFQTVFKEIEAGILAKEGESKSKLKNYDVVTSSA